MSGVAILTDYHAGMLDCIIRVDQFAANYSGVWMRSRIGLKVVEPTGRRQGIIVEEDQVLALGGFGADVAANSKSAIFFMRNDLKPAAEAAKHLAGLISRA